ncbi:phage tail protein [Acinetobacter seifertii]|uniref:phage tail protein n=1 Tax=Acinetobacter seifertii TaxID=1530123 RepID=UPI00168D3B93|nr:phage tail protein [Acinetobacter seifertii]QNY28183.1 tail fiber protein [Acinetobacter seifertii]
MTIEKLTEFAKLADDKSSNTEGLVLEKGFPSSLQPARQWFNWLLNSLTKKINEMIDELGNTSNAFQEQLDNSIGLISICPFPDVPEDHRECIGETLLIADYPKLFAKIGTTYGGDGTTNFKTPDYRALFIRGLDSGKNEDPGRDIGSIQNESVKLEGSFATIQPTTFSNSGVFSKVTSNNAEIGGAAAPYNHDVINMSSGTETRPKNISAKYVIKVK